MPQMLGMPDQDLTVAVLQSNYLPWKGYFDLINDVDVFVFYDDVQYTKNDWRNRNRIPTSNGFSWLTVPVGKSLGRLICEVQMENDKWQKKHWATIQQNYARCPGMSLFSDYFRDIYENTHWVSLSELNQKLIQDVSGMLNISTRFDDSRNYNLKGTKQSRLIDLLAQIGATRYVSGPSGKNYIDENDFKMMGIELIYKDYSGFPEYQQRGDDVFNHSVSIIDVLLSTGAEAPHFVYGWRETKV